MVGVAVGDAVGVSVGAAVGVVVGVGLGGTGVSVAVGVAVGTVVGVGEARPMMVTNSRSATISSNITNAATSSTMVRTRTFQLT